jgi:hypothetical protein
MPLADRMTIGPRRPASAFDSSVLLTMVALRLSAQ